MKTGLDHLPAVERRDQARLRGWFNTLVEAYVKARYSKHFAIEAEALQWLGDRTAALLALVETACRAHLAKLKRATGADRT